MRIHIVRPGDTLWKLSQRYNVPLQKLLNANPQIQDPNQLKVGEKVRIPTGGIPVKPPSKPEKPMPPGRPDRGEYPSSERGWESGGHRERWPTMPSTPGTPYGGMYGCWPYAPWMGPPGIPHLCTGGVFSGTVFLDGMPTAHDDLSDARAVFGSRCRDVRSEI